MLTENSSLGLSFYQVAVCVESDAVELLQALEHDFSYFVSEIDHCDFKLSYHCQKPDYSSLPAVTASMATPRNICFKDRDNTYIDYFGKALNIYNNQENSCNIYTDDKNLARQIAYLTILSRVSEKLDQRRIHRIHALGLEHKRQAVLILLPCGGGKTTLAMSVLTAGDKDIKLLSEDSPLLKNDGSLLPFPLRIGVRQSKWLLDVDSKFTRQLKTIKGSLKTTIDIRYFSGKIHDQAVKPGIILLGLRSTGNQSQITPAARITAMKYCLMNSVVGVGLYQGMEFIMQAKFLELIANSRIILSRAYNNLILMLKSKVFTFVIGRDVEKNYTVLRRFLEDFHKR